MGVVTSLQFNNKDVETARKGEEVCVKIDSVPGEAPKMFGRHFDEKVLDWIDQEGQLTYGPVRLWQHV